MGGHGFSSFNRMSHLYHNNDACTTLEGDNNLLLQQTSKYILKAAMKGGSSIVPLSFLMEDDI